MPNTQETNAIKHGLSSSCQNGNTGQTVSDIAFNNEEANYWNLTIKDTRKLIDIVSKLQNNYQISSIIPLLYKLEELLEIKGITVGVYNSTTMQNRHIIGLTNNELPSQLKQHIERNIKSQSIHSNFGHHRIFYGNPKDELCAYLYFERESCQLTNDQLQLIRFIQPYLYSTACRLFQMNNEISELNLTSREQEVMEWIKEGKDNWTIGKILGVSERTIKFHVCNLFKKIGVTSRIEAICWYFSFLSSTNSEFPEEDSFI